jgi:hypothetical protein
MKSASNVSHGRFTCGLSYNFPYTLKMEAIRSSETSVNTISTRYHIPEDCFLLIVMLSRCFRNRIIGVRLRLVVPEAVQHDSVIKVFKRLEGNLHCLTEQWQGG